MSETAPEYKEGGIPAGPENGPPDMSRYAPRDENAYSYKPGGVFVRAFFMWLLLIAAVSSVVYFAAVPYFTQQVAARVHEIMIRNGVAPLGGGSEPSLDATSPDESFPDESVFGESGELTGAPGVAGETPPADGVEAVGRAGGPAAPEEGAGDVLSGDELTSRQADAAVMRKYVEAEVLRAEGQLHDRYFMLLAVTGGAVGIMLLLFGFLQAMREEKAELRVRRLLDELKWTRDKAASDLDEAARERQEANSLLTGNKKELEKSRNTLVGAWQGIEAAGKDLMELRASFEELRDSDNGLENLKAELLQSGGLLDQIASGYDQRLRGDLGEVLKGQVNDLQGLRSEVSAALGQLAGQLNEFGARLERTQLALSARPWEYGSENSARPEAAAGSIEEAQNWEEQPDWQQVGANEAELTPAEVLLPEESAALSLPVEPGTALEFDEPGGALVSESALETAADFSAVPTAQDTETLAAIESVSESPVTAAAEPAVEQLESASPEAASPSGSPAAETHAEAGMELNLGAPLEDSGNEPSVPGMDVTDNAEDELAVDASAAPDDVPGGAILPGPEEAAALLETELLESPAGMPEGCDADENGQVTPGAEFAAERPEAGSAFAEAPILPEQAAPARATRLSYEAAIETYRAFPLEQLEELAGYGDAMAHTELGHRYFTGGGVARDPHRAMEHTKVAVSKGNPIAMVNLGFMHIQGLGGERDFNKAFELYSKAAAQDYTLGILNLGLLYVRGHGIGQDFRKAHELFSIAAERGNPLGMLNLGVMYKYGDGVEQSYEKSFEMYSRAAALGNSAAQANLAEFYERGTGVEADPAKASEWYLRAADSGNVDSMLKAAKRYLSGIGLPVDRPAAYTYLLLYKAFSTSDATKIAALMVKFGELLTPEQIAGAEQRAAVLWRNITGIQ